MAYREDDDKGKEGGDLAESSVDEVLDETKEDEEEDEPTLGGGLEDDEKAWE